jgi:hypothetical protein
VRRVTRLGCPALFVCIIVLLFGGGVLAEQHAFQAHHRSCPRHQRVACPQDLQAARGLKAGELRVSWQRVAHPQDAPALLGEAAVTVIVDGGGAALVGTAPAGATSVRFDTVPRGRDLAIAAAWTRQGHVISEVCRLRIRSTQTRTGDRTPSRSSSPAPVPATVTTTTTTRPPPGTRLPSVTDLTIRPGSPSHSSIIVTWSAPGPTAHIAEFRLQHCFQGADCKDHVTRPSSATMHTESSLGRNTAYHFRIRAVANPNSGYEDSDWSPIAEGKTTTQPLPQVTVVSAEPGSPSHSSMTLTWSWMTPGSPNNLTGFRLQRCGNASCTGTSADSGTASDSDRSHTFTGLTRNTPYHFRIQAVGSQLRYTDSDWSSPVPGTTDKEPLPLVTGLVAQVATPTNLIWNPSSHEQLDSYEIRVCSADPCTSANVTATLTAGTSEGTATNPLEYTCTTAFCYYQIRAKAKDGSGYTYGPWSA